MKRGTKHPASTLRHLRGLTLIELMLSLAMMAIIASLAVPESARLMSRWKLQAAAERLAADLQTARLDAAERGLAQHVQINGGTAWCWSISESPGCGCEESLHCQRARVTAPSSGGIQLHADARIRFGPTADAQTLTHVLPLSNPHGDRMQVTLTPMGRAYICSPDGPRMSYPGC